MSFCLEHFVVASIEPMADPYGVGEVMDRLQKNSVIRSWKLINASIEPDQSKAAIDSIKDHPEWFEGNFSCTCRRGLRIQYYCSIQCIESLWLDRSA